MVIADGVAIVSSEFPFFSLCEIKNGKNMLLGKVRSNLISYTAINLRMKMKDGF